MECVVYQVGRRGWQQQRLCLSKACELLLDQVLLLHDREIVVKDLLRSLILVGIAQEALKRHVLVVA